jgi:5'-3' exonuclease
LSTALIDGDILVYLASSVSQQKLDFEDGEGPMITTDMAHAKAHISGKINEYAEAVGATKIIIALSCSSRRYWRHNILPTYKGNRKTVERPV